MTLQHTRAISDVSSLLSVQLANDGTPINLTGKTVTFNLYTLAGVAAISNGACTVPNAALGYVDYDWPGTILAGDYKGWFTVTTAGEAEIWPPNEDGIAVTLFDPTTNTTPEDPSIDIVSAVNNPSRTRTVEGTVEERPISELIKADQYTSGKTAGDTCPWGIRIARTKPGGTVT